jgi:hypothetical protein
MPCCARCASDAAAGAGSGTGDSVDTVEEGRLRRPSACSAADMDLLAVRESRRTKQRDCMQVRLSGNDAAFTESRVGHEPRAPSPLRRFRRTSHWYRKAPTTRQGYDHRFRDVERGTTKCLVGTWFDGGARHAGERNSAAACEKESGNDAAFTESLVGSHAQGSSSTAQQWQLQHVEQATSRHENSERKKTRESTAAPTDYAITEYAVNVTTPVPSGAACRRCRGEKPPRPRPPPHGAARCRRCRCG